MNPKDDWKQLANESGLNLDERTHNVGAEDVLNELRKTPGLYQVEPPAGYEQHLLKALSARLPQKQVAHQVSRSRNRWTLVGWSMVTSFAVALLVLGVFGRSSLNRSPGLPEDDLIASTVERGGAQLVSRWIASMGDSGQRMASQDQLESLPEGQDPRVVDRALREVAKSMGMTF